MNLFRNIDVTWFIGFGLVGFILANETVGRFRHIYEINVYNEHLLWYLFLGLLGGVICSLSKNKVSFSKFIEYGLFTMLRYYVAYKLLASGYAKIDDNYFITSISTLDTSMIDLEPRNLVWSFFGFSYGYQACIGVVEIVGAALLLFRRTAIMGSIICTAYMFNVTLIGYYFDLNSVLFSFLLLLTSAFPLVFYRYRLFQFVMNRTAVARYKYPIFQNRSRLYQSLNVLKLVLIAGPIVTYLWESNRINRWYRYNYEHPVVGAWVVEDLSVSNNEKTDTIQFPDIEKLFIERGRWGKLKSDDTSSRFEYIVDTLYNQFEMYNFYDYRDVDIKGKYHMLGKDTLLFEGKNNKDELRIMMIRDKRFE